MTVSMPPAPPAPLATVDLLPERQVRGERVLVTGAGGFLGANLVHALHGHGFRVRALVRRPPEGPQWQGLSGVEFILGDIRRPEHVARMVEGVGSILHAAALTQLNPQPRRDAFTVNVDGTRLLCAAAARASVRRLVFTSSASTLAPGTAEKPARETDRAAPLPIPSPYYTSKRLAECLVLEQSGRGLETIALCPGYILGPRDMRPTTNELVLLSTCIPVLWLPPGGMNVIDVREAALAHVRALWLGQPGRRYFLAGPYASYAEMARTAQQVIGSSRRVHVMPSWLRWPGSLVLALLNGVLPGLPNGLTVPSFRYAFVPFHLCGRLADETFHLKHRPLAQTIADTLRWFQNTGQAPWLSRRL
jgi:dihydroflavonol-4-reductase